MIDNFFRKRQNFIPTNILLIRFKTKSVVAYWVVANWMMDAK